MPSKDRAVRAGTAKLRACLICGGDVEQSRRWGTWNRFCGRSCAGTWMQRQRTPEQSRRWGREGAKARAAVHHEHVIEKFEKHGRHGYWLAYQAGRQALKVATLKAKQVIGVATSEGVTRVGITE